MMESAAITLPEWLGGLSALDIGATGLLTLAVIMILTGRLIPRWVYQQTLKAYEAERDARIEESRTSAKALDNLGEIHSALESIQSVGGAPEKPLGGKADA